MLQQGRELLMTYRLYFMDRAGHFLGMRPVEADDEAQALARAERMGPCEVRELWDRKTMLKHWNGQAVRTAFTSTCVITACAMLMTTAAVAQPAPQKGSTAQPSVVRDTPRATTSNPWDTLPAMSVDRCMAEAIGTASDPRTGAPITASIDPQTGKPLCPSQEPKPKPR
jgi:hypothetical protein